ncbi:MAG: transporter substrate-binding domain-containing protein [Actinobacteria bacterium]|nr:transporter substrate-binding domain-containing protein [Actinomycetota bacterium]MCL5887071.1 transporter substrate-binding domain-containing protein [Actinomycetota bacterium]
MRYTRATLVLASICTLALLVGCAPEPEVTQLEPKIEPPLIAEAGVLRVGVDLEHPPFAGVDEGTEAGIDIDVASAVAASLGLELQTVQVTPADAASALEAGRVDVVMSVPLDELATGGFSMAGVYMTDGPAFFVRATDAEELSSGQQDPATLETPAAGTTTPTVTADMLTPFDFSGKRIGAQQESAAYWALYHDLGEGAFTVFPTIREAIEALSAGEIDVVAGGAAVTAYVVRDFDDVVFAGQYGAPTALGVAVAPDAEELGNELRSVLEDLAAGGAIEAIRTTWAGTFPRLAIPR